LAFNVGPSVKREKFSHHHPHPHRVGISRAFVVINDGAYSAAKNDVACPHK
jgi:hypothetical protein